MNVLAAISIHARRRVGSVLQPWDATFVHTLPELRATLERRPFDLVVVGAHFDASQGVRAVEEVLALHSGPPVVALVATPFLRRGDLHLGAFRAACLALGAADVLDLGEWPQDAEGDRAVRRRIKHALRSARAA
jgi:hypothetical protein